MLLAARCLSPLIPVFARSYARVAHPASPPTVPIVRATPASLLATYRKHWPHPVLALLSAVASSRQDLQDTLQAANVSTEEYNRWAPVASAPDMSTALARADSLLAATENAPAWAVLSILLKQPTDHIQVYAAHTLALSRPPHASDLDPLCVLLSAFWLAHYRMYAPLRTVVLRVVRSTATVRPYQITFLLRILGQAPPAHDLQDIIAVLLNEAIHRKIDLGVRTYRVLLDNSAASARTAQLVEGHMDQQAFAPNLALARALVNVYGRVGHRQAAARYWRRIRLGEYHGPKPEHATEWKQQARMLEDNLRSFKDSDTMNAYVRYLLKTAARAKLNPELKKTLRVPTLPHTDRIPKQVWMHSLRVAAEDLSVPAKNLLTNFRTGKDHLDSQAKLLVAYYMVIKGLLRRRKYKLANDLLDEIWQYRDEFDSVKATIAVEALTMNHRPDSALQLLLQLQHAPKLSSGDGEWKSEVLNPKGNVIDTQAINSFMIALLRINRPDAVFYVWDVMHTVFRVDPDSKSVAILLKAARYARKREGAVQVALADFGIGKILARGERAEAMSPQRLGRDDAVKGLAELLAPDREHPFRGFWRGERAGDVALRVAWQVFVGNWPILRGFSAPFHSMRRSASAQATSPMRDLFSSFSLGTPFQAEDGSRSGAEQQKVERAVDPDIVRPFDEDGRTYFGVMPEDAMFRALFDLLAEEDRAAQIPLVLTWMRYLKVRPSRDTLATALVYWGEVTLEGPWIESVRAWRGQGSESQYTKMVKWLTKWVGRKNVPGRAETHKALKRISWFREMSSYRDGGEEEDDLRDEGRGEG